MLEYFKRYIKSITSKEILQITWGLKKDENSLIEGCARKDWSYRVKEAVKCIKIWRGDFIKYFLENAHGQAVPRGGKWVEWELCTVLC